MVKLVESTRSKKSVLYTLISAHKKSGADAKSVVELADKIAVTLDIWDFTTGELEALDRKGFIDLMKSWYDAADTENKRLYTKVFFV